MLLKSAIFVCGILFIQPSLTIWSCSQDADCFSMSGSVCDGGECICPGGTQAVMGGSLCAPVAPYHTSPCYEDYQCSRLFTNFHCRREADIASTEAGVCACRPGFHYFHGRCWQSRDWGQACSNDEECMYRLRDPYAMSCNEGVCGCADGFYLRQRSECRRSGLAVNESCVLDADCRFPGGLCDITTFTCIDADSAQLYLEAQEPQVELTAVPTVSREAGTPCTSSSECVDPFVCFSAGVCVCPLGYYPNDGGNDCLPELGSPVTSPGQCTEPFMEVRDGVCSCQANFYFDEDMRSCVKVSARLSDFCLSDVSCHSFGAFSVCGEPQQWGLRNCECDLNETIWNANLNMCMVFAGIGEECEVDSDCIAGGLEIQCLPNAEGQGVCTCPEEYTAVDGLCLLMGLGLGDSCQVDLECSATENGACVSGQCACSDGYAPLGDLCAPVIGGNCAADTDCVTQNTVCAASSNTCQCSSEFVQSGDTCWPSVSGFDAACNVTEQCVASLGDASSCASGVCVCADDYHYRDGGCWPRTGLFETCSRNSECFLEAGVERVQCRNSLCQCTFDFPYSEELRTCTSSASRVVFNSIIISVASILVYLY